MHAPVRRPLGRRRTSLGARAGGSAGRAGGLAATAALAFAVSALAAPAAQARQLSVDHLTVDRMQAPLGLGTTDPNLGWRLDGDGRGRAQSAYRVLLAGSASALANGSGDVWDSGRVQSGASANVDYRGPALRTATRYHWKVQVWDERGRASDWSAPATFQTGLLNAADWDASWIAAPADTLDFRGASWIWFDENDPVGGVPAVTRWLRGTVTLDSAPIASGRLIFTADDEAAVYVNGTLVADTHELREGDRDAWQKAQSIDVARHLRAGANTIAVQARNRLTQENGTPSPTGFLGRLRVTYDGGAPATTLSTGAGWKAHDSEVAGWQTQAFDDSGWRAARVAAPYGQGPWASNVVLPGGTSPYLRREFSATRAIASARLDVSALGIYELRINGRRVGDELLAPGWTEYDAHVPAQTYDVTGLVRPGANALGALLGEGWYAGRLQGGRRWGTTPALLAQLEITYVDGTRERIVTDDSWRAGSGGVQASGIYDGESFDARAEQPGWDRPSFSGGWPNAVRRSERTTVFPAQAPPIRVTKTLRPVAVTQPAPGTYIFDMGQNFAGWARLHVTGEAGRRVRLRFGEVLEDDGTLYRAHLRGAQQTDTYTLSGDPAGETWEPRFTYHGFRYVEVTGYPGVPSLDAIDGRVVTTDAPRYGSFGTSDALVDRIQQNILWGQWSNFMTVPTDASQRDERLGWTGDIQAFASTAAFNGDYANYLDQWLLTLRDSQGANGAYPDVAPRTCCGEGTAGWGDAGTVVPWELYEHYGDARVLADSYDSMVRWIDYLRANSNGLIRPDAGYGDWLANADTPKDLIGTAFFGYSTELVRRAALVLGKEDDAAQLRALHDQIADAFARRWVRADGRVGSGSQTSYALALHFGLVPEATRAAAAARLAANVEARDGHLSTGFLGTPFLLSVLADSGRGDLAYRILEQRTWPSWGYMIGNGATTIWERWDGIRVDGGFQDPGMNSFNHYGLGSIGDWLYGAVGGIAPDPDAPGYRRIVVRPTPGGTLTDANASVESDYGQARSAWSRDGRRMRLDVEVPVNAVAEVHVPRAVGQEVREAGEVPSQREGVRFLRSEPDALVYEVGSGSYRFIAADPGPGGREPGEPREPPRRGGRDRTAPRIDGAKVSPTRVVAGRRATLRYTVSEPARVRIALQQRRERGRGWRELRTSTVTARSGRNSWTVPTRRLQRGAHWLVLVATDSAGNRSRERAAGFTVTLKKKR
ncbi:family 78 glycoside hydrolase catalytic domain [Conexibacter stalactiti]|uniref:alpha-L-rhamnosidase n=1 Tax=Conexibacter stalactiti TaxID=1940611 RepID=A0ABU4HZ41_9ACTN|nr:family 78 glycoside hydrolase catalytic domain [Conexibacter stalactiti]MDW5598591.1 family 78 glycoside hydrolase catalytic domain [Conexibacter stalactiti]MEC5039233.1 family 78 glycoside hydrolase catalytic domain [Conexibacter stalactiti]